MVVMEASHSLVVVEVAEVMEASLAKVEAAEVMEASLAEVEVEVEAEVTEACRVAVDTEASPLEAEATDPNRPVLDSNKDPDMAPSLETEDLSQVDMEVNQDVKAVEVTATRTGR